MSQSQFKLNYVGPLLNVAVGRKHAVNVLTSGAVPCCAALQDDEDGPAVLAGYGYGLPISRLYARYFGGDLQIISMEGYGTDAYLHLNRLGNVQVGGWPCMGTLSVKHY